MHMALTGEVLVSSISCSTCEVRKADSRTGTWQALLSKVNSAGLCRTLEKMFCPQFLPNLLPHQDASTIP